MTQRDEQAGVKYQPNSTYEDYADLMKISGVVGVGTGISNSVIVYVDNESVTPRVPKTYKGKNVTVNVSGQIHPLKN